MAGLNRVMLIGNVGTDPEMRYTPNGNPVTNFRMAVNNTFTAQDGSRRQETEWFTVVAWNRLAEQCNQYLAKGRRTYVEGRLHSRQWVGNDGQNRFVNEVIANRVLFLDRLGAGEAPPGDQGTGAGPSEEELDPDELPF